MAISAVLTTAGKTALTDWIDGTLPVPTFYVGWGTGAGAAAAGDTTLTTEVDEASGDRVAATLSQPSATISRFAAELEAPLALNGATITEAGLFTDMQAGPGTLVARASGIAQVVATGETIAITFNWTHA